jgi:hypothetical protein
MLKATAASQGKSSDSERNGIGHSVAALSAASDELLNAGRKRRKK